MRMVTLTMCLLPVLLAAGCSLPRSAALQSEILNEQQEDNPSFQLVEVSRDVTPFLAKWPRTGDQGGRHWFEAGRGPDSNVIENGDQLNVVVWDNEENSLLTGPDGRTAVIPTLNVAPSGNVFLPYVGEIGVRGLTEDAARRRLQEAFEGIQSSAQVQLTVVPGRNNSVDVAGGVGAPGRYPLDSRDTAILSVIALSGGIDPSLRNPLVRLQRAGRTYEIRAETILSDPRRNVRVRGGDQIVIVEDDRSFNVLGATGAQKLIYFEKEHMNVMEALSSTGGLNPNLADPQGVLVLREYAARDLRPGLAGPNQQQVVFSIDLTSADGLFAARQFEIQPGDTLLATESPIHSARTIIGLFGTVIGVTSTVNNLSN